MKTRRAIVLSASVIAVVVTVSVVLTMSSSFAKRAASSESAGSPSTLAVYFGETVAETEALTLLRDRQIQNLESSYDTTRVEVGVIVPPTQRQLDAILARPEIWSANIDGAEPRDSDAVLSPEREARLEKKRRMGAICPTIYLRATAVPHVSEKTIRSWMDAIPTAAVPSIRKPANDICVTPSTPEEADAVYALASLSEVQLVAIAE